MHFLQHLSIATILPAVLDRDRAAVFQVECGDVDRVSLAVFRDFCARFVVACPTRVMRRNLNTFQSATPSSKDGSQIA